MNATEPTLTDIAHKLDTLTDRVDNLTDRVDNLTDRVDNLTDHVSQYDTKFETYQKATQWVVQLAFGLIASATVIVIITNVFD